MTAETPQALDYSTARRAGAASGAAGLALAVVQLLIVAGGFLYVWQSVRDARTRVVMALGWQHFALAAAASALGAFAFSRGSRRLAVATLALALVALGAATVLGTVRWGVP